MKHKLILMMAALTLFANSCTTTETPPPVDPPTDYSPLVSDAAAAMETMATFGEFAVTPVSGFAVGALAAILAADASGFFGRQTNATYNNGKPSDVLLPYTKELQSNPFEQIGKMHNAGLDYINKKRTLTDWHNRFINYDATAWIEMIDIVSPGLSDSEKQQLINAAKQAKLVERMQSKAIYKSGTTQQEAISRLSLSPNGQAYINSIVNTCNEMRIGGKTALQMTDYLNREITTRLNPENVYTTEETAILTFLTVAKHSGYYWHN